MDDGDLRRSAAILLQKYGEEAEVCARLKADEALEIRDIQSCAVWKRVALAVSDLKQRDSFHGFH